MSKVVDVTIAYPNGQPLNLWNIISASRPPCVTHVHYRIFDIKEVRGSSILFVKMTSTATRGLTVEE
jgi:hypothetical protein